jgi:hypothetical protein
VAGGEEIMLLPGLSPGGLIVVGRSGSWGCCSHSGECFPLYVEGNGWFDISPLITRRFGDREKITDVIPSGRWRL